MQTQSIDEATLIVEKTKAYGRIRYQPMNPLANEFAKGLDQKTFMAHDLKWIQSLGYKVLVSGPQTEEFK